MCYLFIMLRWLEINGCTCLCLSVRVWYSQLSMWRTWRCPAEPWAPVSIKRQSEDTNTVLQTINMMAAQDSPVRLSRNKSVHLQLCFHHKRTSTLRTASGNLPERNVLSASSIITIHQPIIKHVNYTHKVMTAAVCRHTLIHCFTQPSVSFVPRFTWTVALSVWRTTSSFQTTSIVPKLHTKKNIQTKIKHWMWTCVHNFICSDIFIHMTSHCMFVFIFYKSHWSLNKVLYTD